MTNKHQSSECKCGLRATLEGPLIRDGVIRFLSPQLLSYTVCVCVGSRGCSVVLQSLTSHGGNTVCAGAAAGAAGGGGGGE